jgi:hypothetical protein
MDSEDDMHDANDMESLDDDDDFYSGDTDGAGMDYYSDYDDDDAGDYFDDADKIESRRPEVYLSIYLFSILLFICFYNVVYVKLLLLNRLHAIEMMKF